MEYNVDKEDTTDGKRSNNDKRTNVRFNLEGQYGATAFVFAEVCDSMPGG